MKLLSFFLMGIFLKELVMTEATKHRVSFCQSYEDYEECKEQRPVGPDGPIDDGESHNGPNDPGPDDSGPDDLGDGL